MNKEEIALKLTEIKRCPTKTIDMDELFDCYEYFLKRLGHIEDLSQQLEKQKKLNEEHQSINGQLEIENKKLREENEQLKENWEELKKWISASDEHYPGAIPFRQTIRKMQELERNDSDEL